MWFHNLALYLAVSVQQNLYWLGLFSVTFLIVINRDAESWVRKLCAWFFGLSFLPLGAYYLMPQLSDIDSFVLTASKTDAMWWAGCVIMSWVTVLLWLRFGTQLLEVFMKNFTRTSRLERNKKTDIRYIDKFLPDDKQRFDPLKFIDYNKGYFVGLSEEDRPIYIKQSDWETSHILLTGRTRSGKGVAAQIIGTQSIQRKELFVVLDPKCDNWMPHIFKKACEEAGQPYVFLDLRQTAHPQINMFEGCTEEVIENMLIAAFGIAPKGDKADAYRTIDRKAARQAARYIASHPGATAREVLDALGSTWREPDEGSKLSALIFAELMSEMAELRSVNRKSGGINFDDLVRTGGCLYVVGDMINTRIITMQRMILIRLMMMAKNREQTDDMRIIRVFADEFRVHISRPFIVGLGASAGWKLLCLLAFQSFEDLRDCPADLDADMVKGSVIENCALQLSNRIKDAATAEVLAAATGTIQVDDETRPVDKNMALSETVGNDRRISQAERYYMDVNMITSLPVPDIKRNIIGCGVLVGASKLAQFCFTSPIIVERGQSAITPTTPPPTPDDSDKTLQDKLDNLEVINEPRADLSDLPPLE